MEVEEEAQMVETTAERGGEEYILQTLMEVVDKVMALQVVEEELEEQELYQVQNSMGVLEVIQQNTRVELEGRERQIVMEEEAEGGVLFGVRAETEDKILLEAPPQQLHTEREEAEAVTF